MYVVVYKYTYVCWERLSNTLTWLTSLYKIWSVVPFRWWPSGHCPPLMFGKASLKCRTWRSCNTCNTWGVFRVWLRVGGLRGLRSFLRQVGELCDVHWGVLVLGVAVGEGGVHHECTHPFGMACFWPSLFYFCAPNFGELRELED